MFGQVGDKVCQNERTNLEHQLELIRNDPETGMCKTKATYNRKTYLSI